jgi:hypothetical protein
MCDTLFVGTIYFRYLGYGTLLCPTFQNRFISVADPDPGSFDPWIRDPK